MTNCFNSGTPHFSTLQSNMDDSYQCYRYKSPQMLKQYGIKVHNQICGLFPQYVLTREMPLYV